MIEDIHFLDDGQIRITAASVGISRLRWIFVEDSDIALEQGVVIMKTNRFDHLPIVSQNKTVRSFFKTENNNDYTIIARHDILVSDLLPLETNIREVIAKFATSDRSFYFLTARMEILGLITIGNLNCKQVQIYVFSLICELERELAAFLYSQINDDQILDWASKKIDINNPMDKYLQIKKAYEDLVRLDLENSLTELFFFVDFFNIIRDLKLFKKLNYSRSKWDELNSINELRKRIAHPTRNLLDGENNISKLNSRLGKVENLLFNLHNFKSSSSS